MPGIPGWLLIELRDTLAACPDFETNEQLKAVFEDKLLEPWQRSLPQVDSEIKRADLVIQRLRKEIHEPTQTSVLVLLLLVLRDRYRSTPARANTLERLARELENALQPDDTSHTAQATQEANPDNQPMIHTEQYHRIVEFIQTVGKMSVPQFMQGKATLKSFSGTGWLITPDLAVTCEHVMRARESPKDTISQTDLIAQAANSTIAFDYTQYASGIQYQVKALECHDPNLDYAVLRLQLRTDYPLSKWGFLKLDREAPLNVGTKFYVIQHPKGQPQQLSGGRFVQFEPNSPYTILHSAPTERGTSGAPVLNLINWRVVALHKGENPTFHLRRATRLEDILAHIQQVRPDVHAEILSNQ